MPTFALPVEVGTAERPVEAADGVVGGLAIDVPMIVVLDNEEIVAEAAFAVVLPPVEPETANPQLTASSIASLSASPPLERIQLPQLRSKLEASAELQTQFE